MLRYIFLVVLSVVFSCFTFGQEGTEESIFFDGCWTGNLFAHIDTNVFNNCDNSKGSLIIRLRKNGTCWIYTRNQNMPQRCGNFLVQKINFTGNYEYNTQTRILRIFSDQGMLKFNWEIATLNESEIRFTDVN